MAQTDTQTNILTNEHDDSIANSAQRHPYPREKFRLKKSTKKRILRNFICHLDRHFLKFLAILVGNQQRTETTNPLQIDTF